jgi:hypothetical protein
MAAISDCVYGCARGAKDLLGGARFYDVASLHDGDACGELRDDEQATRNQQIGQRKFALQLLQQLEELRAEMGNDARWVKTTRSVSNWDESVGSQHWRYRICS